MQILFFSYSYLFTASICFACIQVQQIWLGLLLRSGISIQIFRKFCHINNSKSLLFLKYLAFDFYLSNRYLFLTISYFIEFSYAEMPLDVHKLPPSLNAVVSLDQQINENRKTIKEILCMDPYQHKVLLQMLLHTLLTLVFNFYNNFFLHQCRIYVSLAKHPLLTMISSMDGGPKHAQNALKHSLDLQTTSDALNMGFQNLHQFHGEKY